MPTETSSSDLNPNLVRKVNFAPAEPTPLSPAIKIDTIVSTDSVEPPVDVYEDRTGHPLLVDILDISQVYGRTEQDDLVKAIDKYVLEEIGDRKYKATKESYKSIVSELKAKANISDMHDYTEQIKKLSIYVDALKQARESKRLMRVINANQ